MKVLSILSLLLIIAIFSSSCFSEISSLEERIDRQQYDIQNLQLEVEYFRSITNDINTNSYDTSIQTSPIQLENPLPSDVEVPLAFVKDYQIFVVEPGEHIAVPLLRYFVSTIGVLSWITNNSIVFTSLGGICMYTGAIYKVSLPNSMNTILSSVAVPAQKKIVFLGKDSATASCGDSLCTSVWSVDVLGNNLKQLTRARSGVWWENARELVGYNNVIAVKFYYWDSRNSKTRETLAWLEDNGVWPESNEVFKKLTMGKSFRLNSVSAKGTLVFSIPSEHKFYTITRDHNPREINIGNSATNINKIYICPNEKYYLYISNEGLCLINSETQQSTRLCGSIDSASWGGRR